MFSGPEDVSSPGLGTNVRHAGRRLLRRAKYFTGDRPWLLPVNVRLTPEGTDREITDSTDIVIEGFPRSGNTFAVFALRSAQPEGVSIASHIHHLAPLKIAARRRLPLVIVARDPVDCLSSYLIAGPHARPRGVLKEYIHHHTGVLDFGDDAVFATFDQVTTDLPSVVERVNARFGTSFEPFTHEPAAEAAVFAAIEEYHAAVHRRKDPARVVPRPDSERKAEAARWREQLLDAAHRPLLDRARSIYAEFSAVAEG